jgi:hypothetical protein
MYGSTAPRRTRTGYLGNRIQGLKIVRVYGNRQLGTVMWLGNGMMLHARALSIISARRTSTERAQRVLAARLLYQRDLAVRRRV